QRLKVDRAALFLLELGTQLGFLALQRIQFVTLAADQGEPGQAHDHQRDQHAEHHLGLLRPVADVVEVQLVDVEFLLAHAAPFCTLAGALVESAGTACGGARRLPSFTGACSGAGCTAGSGAAGVAGADPAAGAAASAAAPASAAGAVAA